MGRIKNGATAPPIEDPLSYSAVAKPLARLENHSQAPLSAPGQYADSPAPSKTRKNAKLLSPLASEVSSETAEYQATLIVSPRRVPTRSIHRPQTVCPIVYATRNAIAIFA